VPGQPAHDARDHHLLIGLPPLGKLQELGQAGQVAIEDGRLLATEPEGSLSVPSTTAKQVLEGELGLAHSAEGAEHDSSAPGQLLAQPAQLGLPADEVLGDLRRHAHVGAGNPAGDPPLRPVPDSFQAWASHR
jgi:hypothetical protein